MSDDTKLPEIIWKFRRGCEKMPRLQQASDRLTQNPHFYPIRYPRMRRQMDEGIPPLSRRDRRGVDPMWSRRIHVCGDDPSGCIKLTSEDGTITKIYATITRALGSGPQSELTIFKGLLDYSRNLLLLT